MKKIVNLLKEMHPEFDYVDSENFIEDGYLDSFDLITLVAALEAEYTIKIKGTEIIPENFCTVEAIKSLVSSYGVSDEI